MSKFIKWVCSPILLCIIVLAYEGCDNSVKNKTAIWVKIDSINNSNSNIPIDAVGTMIGKIYFYNAQSGIADLSLLNGYIFAGGRMFESKSMQNYTIASFDRRDTTLLVIDSCVRDDKRQVCGYKIIDTLLVPSISDSETLDYSNCIYDTVYNSFIVALFKNQQKGIWTNALKAWKIDTINKKILSIDTAHIRLNPPTDEEAD